MIFIISFILKIRFCLPKDFGDACDAVLLSFFPCLLKSNFMLYKCHVDINYENILKYLESFVVEVPDCLIVT